MTPNSARLETLDRFSRFGLAVVIAVGTTVIFGWFLDIPFLKSVVPGFASMKMNTAGSFVIASVALCMLRGSEAGSTKRLIARVLALFVMVLAALTLAEDIFGLDFGIDQFVISDIASKPHAIYPGRMSTITSFCFLIVGIALLGLKARQRLVAVCAHWIALLPLFLSIIGIVGYAYGVDSLYQVKPFNSMALHTGVLFFILALSIKAADPMHGIAHIMTSNTAGGAVGRRLLPTIPPVLIALGWLRLMGEEAGYYDMRFGLALMVSMSIGVCVIAILSTAYALRRVDLTRLRAESEVDQLNTGLEKLLEERIEQVARLSAALAENKSLERDSLHDGLTDIPNRRFLDTFLARQIAIARRYKRSLAFVLCDVDAFKSYNDHYGHLTGDECLKKVAAAIRTSCKRPADMAARYGGEEFALVLPDTDLAGAVRIAEVAREAVARVGIPHAYSSAGRIVSISGGVAVLLGEMTAEELIAAADKSLYRAKHEGRNRIVSMHAEAA